MMHEHLIKAVSRFVTRCIEISTVGPRATKLVESCFRKIESVLG